MEVMNKIKQTNEPANYTDKWEVVRLLQQAVQNGESVETQKQHIENINDMLGKERIFD
jgi:hypothetical protein